MPRISRSFKIPYSWYLILLTIVNGAFFGEKGFFNTMALSAVILIAQGAYQVFQTDSKIDEGMAGIFKIFFGLGALLLALAALTSI